MKAFSGKLSGVREDDVVTLPVSEVDRGKTDVKALLCRVMKVDHDKGSVILCTPDGRVKGHFVYNSFGR